MLIENEAVGIKQTLPREELKFTLPKYIFYELEYNTFAFDY